MGTKIQKTDSFGWANCFALKRKIGTWNPKPWMAYRLDDMMVVTLVSETQKAQSKYTEAISIHETALNFLIFHA